MKTESLPSYNWFVGKDAKHWSRAFFKDIGLCDMLCNNMCEAFNAAILAARDKPIITMMEMIRNYMMTRPARKMAELEKLFLIACFKFVEKVKHKSGYYYPQYSGNFTYQVRARREEQFVIDINDRTCGFNKWQLIGIPCVHGMTALLSTNHNPMDFIHLRKQRGRPKKKRNLQSDEIIIGNTTKLRRNYVVVRCRKSGKVGHNRVTCDRRGRGTDSVATTEGRSQSVGGTQADGGSQPVGRSQSVPGLQAEHQDGQPRGGKRT
ncbi:hypothetical protein Dsin_020770 [Dipteronia sinensis]|uniref:Zinc finger PMZ-type domain-containing protein n=1 Tax=Dipteronia sinensis TaxID=43782 RepID=A0AAE0AAI6_9ROSI|nr:hypothetical protein Dsin_020770 [Dipteronia sinensis]